MIVNKQGPDSLILRFNTEDTETPCMVFLNDASATFDCAIGEGEVEHIELTNAQYEFLVENETFANKFYDKVRIVR